MTIFRAVGVSSTFTRLGKDDAPIYTCVVRFLEITDNPATERVLSEQTFHVASDLELKIACDAVLAELLKTHEVTTLALDITRKTIGEVSSPLPDGARGELVIKTAVAGVKR